IAERNQERGKKIQEQKRNLETFDWDKDYVPYGHSVQEKIKAKEFEPTFAKYIFDFEKIIKCLACDAFPKYSPTGLCQYHDFCLKFGYHHEFPNNQYTPPSQDLKANPPTSYDVLTKVFKYQKFQESQEMAISEYVNGNHTFVSMRTGAGKSMCYWISAIMRGGLTIVISPLVSLIDDQVIETIAAGIGCASIYTESFVYNESFTKMLLNFSKNSPVSFVIDEVHSVQEKIKAKEFEPTFAKYIFDFEKIIKCLACDAFPKYSPTGLCQYHDFCLKFGYHHEFPNNQYTPPSQDLKANPPTSYDVLTKVFKYQKFQESQEMAISEYVNGNHTFVSMRTGAGKSMCYWISAIMRGGLTIVISPLVSLIDDQVIETIAAGIGCASIYTGEDRPREYFEKVFSEIAVGLTKLIYVTAESFVYNESFTKMLLNFSKNSPVSFVIDEVHCIIESGHYRESWNKLRKITTLFPDIPIMMLTGTCKEIDAHAILENLCISPSDVTFVRGISFSRPELKIEVHSKSTKEKLIREIIMLLKELEDGKCPTVHVCDNVYELLCEKADLDMNMAVYYSSLGNGEKNKKLKSWKDNKIQIMIATNAFGMGINDKKIRLVIHYTFPLSIGNLVQETGRAGRDHNSAKSVIFYSRHDICTNYTIITQGRESVTEEVDEVQAKPVSKVNLMSDVLKMVEVSEEVVNKLNKNGKIATPKDIIQVYCQLKCDHEELTLLNTYKDKTFKQERLIKTKAEALHLLDLLIIRKIVKVMINLYRPNSNGSILQTNLHIFGVIEGATAMIMQENWEKLFNSRQK
ncbi:13542_t:CDS:2, partial [Entrophospora sp. SA101]